jgi:hypothetical protein
MATHRRSLDEFSTNLQHGTTTEQVKVKGQRGKNKPKVLYVPYIRGMSERIERGCKDLGVRTVFKSRHTLRQTLMNVKSKTPEECKRGAVYEIPCADCDSQHWRDRT